MILIELLLCPNSAPDIKQSIRLCLEILQIRYQILVAAFLHREQGRNASDQIFYHSWTVRILVANKWNELLKLAGI